MDAAEYLLSDEWSTRRWSRCLARALEPIGLAEQSFAVHLRGDLGVGKTTLVRHLLAALGIAGPVKSPSYALLEPYNGPRFGVYHFDLYRFSSGDEWAEAGFDEIVDGPGLVLVEWPERADGTLPEPDLVLELTLVDEASGLPGPADSGRLDAALPPADGSTPVARRLRAVAASAQGRQCLSAVVRCWSPAAPG